MMAEALIALQALAAMMAVSVFWAVVIFVIPAYLALVVASWSRHVPTTFLFAFVGDRIVGRVTIRLMLNEHLERNGGHIGYVIAPEFRRRGYATRMLASSLRIAREQFRLSRVLLTVDDDNLGSIKAIEKNGGVFDRMVDQAGEERPKRRYWIETGRNI